MTIYLWKYIVLLLYQIRKYYLNIYGVVPKKHFVKNSDRMCILLFFIRFIVLEIFTISYFELSVIQCDWLIYLH